MGTTIRVALHKISEPNRALLRLEGPRGEADSCEFVLPWSNDQDWRAVFLSLGSYANDSTTWPRDPDTIDRARELGLFVHNRPSNDRFSIVGTELYRAVFGSQEIRNLFNRLILPEQNEIPIVQLHVSDEGSILLAYPWELLHDEHDFLFSSRRAFVVRYIDFEQPIPVIDRSGDLRVLVVDPRPDMLQAKYDRLPLLERPTLERLASQRPGQFSVSVLGSTSVTENTLSQMHDYLMTSHFRTHILHVDTHGDYGWLCNCAHLNPSNTTSCKHCDSRRAKDQMAKGYLAFRSEDGQVAWVSGEMLGRQLNGRDIQVVVLSACRSGLVAGTSAFNSIAGALIKQGIPAVVAMQFSIEGQATEVFAENFYIALLARKPLTEAVAEARAGLEAYSNESWYRPVLYLRTDPTNYQGEVFCPDASQSQREVFPVQVVRRADLETPAGTISPESRFYVERKADSDCWEELSRNHAVTIAIKAPRQMGKSSLLHRMIQKTKQVNRLATAFIDFQKFPEQLLNDEEAFLIEFCFMLSDALQISEAIDHYWPSQRRSSIIKCSNYLSQHVIPTVNKPFILVMDETERLFNSPFRSNFFGMLRTWHNDRASDANFAKMSLLISYSTEPYLFLDNINQSPFNVTQPILLHDFTMSEVEELNQRHGSPLSDLQLGELFDLLGGHPYLTRLALYLLASQETQFDTLMATATSDDGPFGEHLTRYWSPISEMPDVRYGLQQACLHYRLPTNKLYYRLKGAGLIRADADRVVMRNTLYERFFSERLSG